jgi:hypothetical protein
VKQTRKRTKKIVRQVENHNFQHDLKVIQKGAKVGGKALQTISNSGIAGKYSQQIGEAGDALRLGGGIAKAGVKSKLLK